MRIVQISDTHVTRRGGITNENFRRLVTFINDELKPDLVVHSGDICALTPGVGEDLELALSIAGGVEAPFKAIPGNHDIGMVGEHAWMGFVVTSETVSQFRETFGEDRWLVLDDPDWAVLGLSDEMIGSGIPEEQEQWEWLEEAVATIGERSVVIFLHKPVWSPLPEGAVADHPLFVQPADRDRLLGLFRPGQVKAIGSGHLHRFRTERRGDILEVWAPATAFIAGEQLAKMAFSLPDGLDQLGVVEYVLEDGRATAWFRSLPDLAEVDMMRIPELKADLESLSQDLVAATPGA